MNCIININRELKKALCSNSVHTSRICGSFSEQFIKHAYEYRLIDDDDDGGDDHTSDW